MIEELKNKCLVIDVETSSHYPNGEPIDLRTNFEDYVKYAKVKWLGMYSYLLNKYNEINVVECDPQIIKDYIAQHDTIISFNGEEFDTPIMYNNDLMPENKRYLQVDCMVILGESTFQKRDGTPYKKRGTLMGYKFKRNSLKVMAETMGLETQKGDIDYTIFQKNLWTCEEIKEIKKYLQSDIKATKEMFDKLWEFWMPFTKFISEDNIRNLSWIRSSIASLRYKGDCYTLGVEETYGEKSLEKEEMGGNVISIKYEEARGVWYLDFGSLYPWIRNMFCIDNEITNWDDAEQVACLQDNDIFHENNLFKTKGYYDISYQSPIALKSIENLTLRAKLKIEEPENPLIYAIKIYENAGYGAMRSQVFEQIHTPNAGWDICYLGQQLQEYVNKRMIDFGFETIAGDTDSIFDVLKDKSMIPEGMIERDYVKQCLKTIIEEIKQNVPYPSDVFIIDIENYLDYVMWPFSEEAIIDPETGKNKKNAQGRLIKKLRGKKKNYVYLYHKGEEIHLKIMGLPIKKDNATKLGPQIFTETLEPIFKKNMRAKISKQDMTKIINEWLIKPNAIEGLAREFKVKPFDTYKKESQIQAQISKGYFNGQAGVINLIKNKKIGNAGKTSKYCTLEEANEAKLEIKDLDLTKLKNELSAFIKMDEEDKKRIEKEYQHGLESFWEEDKEQEQEKFFDSDLFDSNAVGDDISNKEF